MTSTKIPIFKNPETIPKDSFNEKDKEEDVELVDQDGPFVHFSFRGSAKWIIRDHIHYMPYLDTLVNGPMKNNARDKKGRIMVDENYYGIQYIIDRYRQWLEDDRPEYLATGATGLIVSVAKRMCCDPAFITALKAKHNKADPNDCFECYYCGNIYLHGERRVF